MAQYRELKAQNSVLRDEVAHARTWVALAKDWNLKEVAAYEEEIEQVNFRNRALLRVVSKLMTENAALLAAGAETSGT